MIDEISKANSENDRSTKYLTMLLECLQAEGGSEERMKMVKQGFAKEPQNLRKGRQHVYRTVDKRGEINSYTAVALFKLIRIRYFQLIYFGTTNPTLARIVLCQNSYTI